jgi:hypothetical protein
MAKAHIPLMYKYVIGTTLYGVARKAPLFFNEPKIREYDNNYNKIHRPMLLTEKVLVSFCTMFVTPYMAPIWMYKDIAMLEVFIRGLDHHTYNTRDKNNTILDYVWS